MEILFRAEIGVPAVLLTRSPEVAAYWALLKRDNDEGRGSIFVFDRQSLASRYKINCNPEVYWHSDTTFHDEAEEQIFDNVTKISDHLIGDRKSTRLNSSHSQISYAVFCLKKKKKRKSMCKPHTE